MNDYYIGVDQNGQPYISHANPLQTAAASVRSAGAGLGRGVRRYHKYLMKIGEGAKARYLYTQQEVQAYMRGGRKALDQMANKSKGIRERNELKKRKADLELSKSEASRAKRKASEAKKGVIYDSNGNEWYKSEKEARRAADTELDAIRKANQVKDNQKMVKVQQDRYNSTLLGKTEKTFNNAKEVAKSTSDRMKEEFRKKKDETVSTVNSVKSKAEERANKASQVMRSKAQDAEDSINSARDKAKGAFDEGKSRVKDSVKSTSDRMKEEFRKKKDEAKNDVHNKLNNAAWKAAKGLEGADVRKQFENAADEFIKNPTPENKKKRDELYDKWAETPHGKFINNEFIAGVQQNGLKDTVKDAVDEGKGRVKDSVKSTSDRMKEEFRKKKDEVKNTKDAIGEKLLAAKKTVEDLKDSIPTPVNAKEKKFKEAFDKAHDDWEKVYNDAVKAQKERSDLQWEEVHGEWKQRNLTDAEKRRLAILKAREDSLVEELDNKAKELKELERLKNKTYNS